MSRFVRRQNLTYATRVSVPLACAECWEVPILSLLGWPFIVPSMRSVCIMVTLQLITPVHATTVWWEQYLLQGVPQLCKCVNTPVH